MLDFPLDASRESTGYHDATSVQTGLNAIPGQVSSHDSAVGKEAEVLGLTSFLFETYSEASRIVENAKYADWPTGVVHADWHPGESHLQTRAGPRRHRL